MAVHVRITFVKEKVVSSTMHMKVPHASSTLKSPFNKLSLYFLNTTAPRHLVNRSQGVISDLLPEPVYSTFYALTILINHMNR